jgi:riboflavin kinase
MLPDSIKALLPHFAFGPVVRGFGRGSKKLGCPTANLPENVVDRLPPGFKLGVYYGWASVDNGPVHKMVMSIGFNPQFRNLKKTMETHILHDYGSDFYGSLLKVVITGFIRDMVKFSSLDELMSAIEADITFARGELETADHSSFLGHSFFQPGGEVVVVAPEVDPIGVDASPVDIDSTGRGASGSPKADEDKRRRHRAAAISCGRVAEGGTVEDQCVPDTLVTHSNWEEDPNVTRKTAEDKLVNGSLCDAGTGGRSML